jgi:4-amino-4-deoxy-L-arabinose transferase-like glycosyltransferase
MKKNVNYLFPYLGLIGIMSLIIILWITPLGPGVQPDSIVYLIGAKSLLAGKGFFNNGHLITHFPPLYSLFLAASNLFVNNLVQAARILTAILFGINAVLVALAVYLTTGRSFLTTTCAVLFFLVSAPLLSIHSYALSEPLFITFTLAFIILLSLYVQRPTLLLFITSSLSLGLAIITRYIGLAFLPVALLIVFVASRDQQPKRRFHDILIWAFLACMPFLILSIINLLIAGSASDRSFIYHPVSEFNYLSEIVDVGLKFIAPTSFPSWVWPAFIGLLAGLFIAQLEILSKLQRTEIDWRSMDVILPALCLLSSASYLIFLFVSLSFFDASTPVDARILSPILAVLIAGGFSAVWTVTHALLKKPMLWRFFLLIVLISISIKTPDAIRSAASIQENGMGYTSTQWRNSDTIAYIKTLSNDVKIYSNGSDVLGFYTENQSLTVPKKTIPTTLVANPTFSEEIGAMCKDILLNRGLLVYFDTIKGRWYLPTQKQVISVCKLSVLHRFADGIVYGEK